MASTISAGTTSHAGAGIASAALGGNVAGNVEMAGGGVEVDVAVISSLPLPLPLPLVVDVSGVAEQAAKQAAAMANAAQLKVILIFAL